MKLFKPQLQLAKESEKVGSSFKDHYYLHVVTFTDQSNYRAADYDVEDSKLASDGMLQVNLYIQADPNIIDLKYLNPVVHTIDLGTPVEKGMEFVVKVDAFKGLPSRDGGGSAGSNQSGSTDADEDGRPDGS